MTRLHVGLTLPQIGGTFPEVVATTRRAEAAGFDGAFLFDHLWPMGARRRPILECWTTLAALTASTERIKVGTLVTRVTIRNPGLLAKMAATVDQIGDGRLVLGLGAGDDLNRDENAAYDLPFFERNHREGSLREAIQIIDRLWRERDPSFEGEHFRLRGATLEPKPVQSALGGRPPIWVGGRSQGARRVTAALADGWNLWGGSPEEFARDVQDLAADVQAEGRDLTQVTPTWAGTIIVETTRSAVDAAVEKWRPKTQRAEVYRGQIVAGLPEECVEQLGGYVRAGARWIIGDFPGFDKRRALDLFAERVLPTLHGGSGEARLPLDH